MLPRPLIATLALACAVCAVVPTTAAAQPLSIYSAQGDEIYAPILKQFSAKYPGIKITVIAGTAGEMLQRIRAEAGRPGADVLLGGPIQSYEAFADLFQGYKSPEDAAAILHRPRQQVARVLRVRAAIAGEHATRAEGADADEGV